jgi:hypothetical protein
MLFFDSHRGLFILIFPYFAFILPFFTSPFLIFFSLSSFFFYIFLLFLFPCSYFFPQMTSADIFSSPQGGRGIFQYIDPWLFPTGIILLLVDDASSCHDNCVHWLGDSADGPYNATHCPDNAGCCLYNAVILYP